MHSTLESRSYSRSSRLAVLSALVLVILMANDSRPIARAAILQTRCAALARLDLPDVRITSAIEVPAQVGRIHAAHCRVDGRIGADVGFGLMLPDDWNGKFFMGGGAGFSGAIENSAEDSVNDGFATVGTDTGHQADGLDARWALGHPERQINFGYLAVHRTAEVAKAIVQRYYGAAPTRSYFFGCSRGGGQALMEAQRYPADFDGLIAGAPAFDWSGAMARFASDTLALFPDPLDRTAGILPRETLQFVEARVLAACDALDGVTDGIMTDPRRCTFDLASLPKCRSDAAGSDCVTTRQVAALKTVYGELRIDGALVYPGQPFGSEGDPGGWPQWISGVARAPGEYAALRPALASDLFRYFVFADPTWTFSQFHPATWRNDTRALAAMLDATSPDLDRFKARSGKLILWHGWSDPALSALRTIEYYEAVGAKDPQAPEYLRMFLLPGVLHCGLGPGPETVDWTSALVDWVEHDRPPERVVARKIDNGTVTRSRPLCAYPAHAEYRGDGSADEAVNFACR